MVCIILFPLKLSFFDFDTNLTPIFVFWCQAFNAMLSSLAISFSILVSDSIGYADLSSSYWQQHLIGAGRVKQ